VREEGSSAERPIEATQVETEDPVRLALAAAELGTWNWHIPTGRVQWTPRTYQLFGFEPGSVVTSQDLFLRQVHAEDRPAVTEWISRALRDRGRTAFDFRIDRPDGSVRRVRSTGRTLANDQGSVVWMVGVIEDITDLQRPLPHAAEAPAQAPSPAHSGGGSLSARQVAHILGVAQVTVKRLAISGEIRSLRSSRKNSQRFAPRDVVDYLRNGLKGRVQFDAAVEGRDVNRCMVPLLEDFLAGTPLEELLDARVLPAARVAPAPFIADLLSRLPYIVPEPPRNAFPALLVEVGIPENLESEVIACLLRAGGHEVLRPAVAPGVNELGELAERVRSRLVVVAIGEGPPALQERGLAVASGIANARSGHTTVCLHAEERLHAGRGVLRFRSMRELAAILKRS